MSLLEVENLKTYFSTPDGLVKAVDVVDLRIEPGSTAGLVGESGSGKSVTALLKKMDTNGCTGVFQCFGINGTPGKEALVVFG